MTKRATDFKAGDVVKVVFKIPAGAKTRPTPFEGIVIATKGGAKNRTFTVRKIASQKVAVERIFAEESPSIESVNVVKKLKVRRAKLYYLRNR